MESAGGRGGVGGRLPPFWSAVEPARGRRSVGRRPVRCICRAALDPVEAVAAGGTPGPRRIAGGARRWRRRRPRWAPFFRRVAPLNPSPSFFSLTTFLKELPVLAKRLDPLLAALRPARAAPLDRALRVRELQSAYVYGTVLAKKARDMLRPLLAPGSVSADAAPRLAWALFASAKAATLPPHPDLVTAFALLVASVAWVLAHVPAADLAPGAEGVLQAADPSSPSPDLAAALASLHRVPRDQVDPLTAALDAHARAVLGGGSGGAARDARGWGPGGRVAGLLSDPAATATALAALDAAYDAAHGASSEIDERPLLDAAAAAGARAPPRTPRAAPVTARSPAPPSLFGASPPPKSHLASRLATPPTLSRCALASPASPAATPLRTAGPAAPSPLRTPGAAPASPFRLLPGATSTGGYALGTPGGLLARGPPAAGASTPVSDTLACLAWLRDAARDDDDVEAALTVAVAGSGADPASLAAAARAGAARVFGPGAGALPAAQADRQREAVALYARTLDAVLAAEEARAGVAAAAPPALARSPRFHAVLLALACECVVAAYRTATLPFPAVLEALALPPFDACKGVDAFVRAHPAMPREVRRHLFGLEERCLEAVAWAPGSPLYVLLAAGAGPAPGDASPVSPAGTPSSTPAGTPASTPSKRKAGGEAGDTPSKRAAAGGAPSTPSAPAPTAAPAGGLSALLSPAPPASATAAPHPTPPAAFGPPESARAGPGATTAARRRAVAAAFLARAERLAALRAADLCDWLDLAPPGGAGLDRATCAARVATLLHHCVWSATALFYGRHVDQVMLCALYGVCKVARARPTFRDIIAAYRRAPHARPDVFRCVAIELAPDLTPLRTGDIIEFYNSVFVGAARGALLALGSGRLPLLPAPARRAASAGAPPPAPPPSPGVWVSPMAAPPPAAPRGAGPGSLELVFGAPAGAASAALAARGSSGSGASGSGVGAASSSGGAPPRAAPPRSPRAARRDEAAAAAALRGLVAAAPAATGSS